MSNFSESYRRGWGGSRVITSITGVGGNAQDCFG